MNFHRFCLLGFFAWVTRLVPTTFETAAAISAAGDARGGDDIIPRPQGVHPPRKEVPIPKLLGEQAWLLLLQKVDGEHEDQGRKDGDGHSHQVGPTGHREAKHGQRDQEEAGDEVENGEPSVLGGDVPQGF